MPTVANSRHFCIQRESQTIMINNKWVLCSTPCCSIIKSLFLQKSLLDLIFYILQDVLGITSSSTMKCAQNCRVRIKWFFFMRIIWCRCRGNFTRIHVQTLFKGKCSKLKDNSPFLFFCFLAVSSFTLLIIDTDLFIASVPNGMQGK